MTRYNDPVANTYLEMLNEERCKDLHQKAKPLAEGVAVLTENSHDVLDSDGKHAELTQDEHFKFHKIAADLEPHTRKRSELGDKARAFVAARKIYTDQDANLGFGADEEDERAFYGKSVKYSGSFSQAIDHVDNYMGKVKNHPEYTSSDGDTRAAQAASSMTNDRAHHRAVVRDLLREHDKDVNK